MNNVTQSPAKPPRFSNDGLIQATNPAMIGDSAGIAEITRFEAFWLACIRNQDVDTLRTLVNSLTGPHGLKLVWSDPLVDEAVE